MIFPHAVFLRYRELFFADMLEAYVEYRVHMVVGEGVIHYLTFAAELHEIRELQRLQLMRNRGFCYSKQSGKVAHTHFVQFKRVENLDSRSVSEHLEQ